MDNVLYQGINFSVAAVTKRSLEEWLTMASKQHFVDLPEEDRTSKLTDIYKQCLDAKKADAATPVVNEPATDQVQDTAQSKKGNTRKNVSQAADEDSSQVITQ